MTPYYNKDGITLFNANCFDVLPTLKAKSIDLILTDPPYNTTACDWDEQPINLDKLWKNLKPLGKDNSAYVFTASQPFTSKLVMSNLKWFKYEWVWIKNRTTNFLNAKKQPLRSFENIEVFYNKQCIFNPTPFSDIEYSHRSKKISKGTKIYGSPIIKTDIIKKKPTSAKDVLFFNSVHPDSLEYYSHPTQKPVALMEYLIKTYTNEGDFILDPFAGSCTTLVAAKKLGRKAVGIEISEKYCEIARQRLRQDLLQ